MAWKGIKHRNQTNTGKRLEWSRTVGTVRELVRVMRVYGASGIRRRMAGFINSTMLYISCHICLLSWASLKTWPLAMYISEDV